ncbi:hypothetical protein, partial [Pseudomonas sp. 2995-1]|uniref:hypothetical protein n=1 Tax=Pseudomonas sp. 2995-1 TaxID=1712679 RepID=UPI001C448C84
IGLLEDIGISVHYSEWNDRDNILSAMKELRITQGFGIDEKAVVYLEDETYSRTFGGGVHFLQIP